MRAVAVARQQGFRFPEGQPAKCPRCPHRNVQISGIAQAVHDFPVNDPSSQPATSLYLSSGAKLLLHCRKFDLFVDTPSFENLTQQPKRNDQAADDQPPHEKIKQDAAPGFFDRQP